MPNVVGAPMQKGRWEPGHHKKLRNFLVSAFGHDEFRRKLHDFLGDHANDLPAYGSPNAYTHHAVLLLCSLEPTLETFFSWLRVERSRRVEEIDEIAALFVSAAEDPPRRLELEGSRQPRLSLRLTLLAAATLFLSLGTVVWWFSAKPDTVCQIQFRAEDPVKTAKVTLTGGSHASVTLHQTEDGITAKLDCIQKNSLDYLDVMLWNGDVLRWYDLPAPGKDHNIDARTSVPRRLAPDLSAAPARSTSQETAPDLTSRPEQVTTKKRLECESADAETSFIRASRITKDPSLACECLRRACNLQHGEACYQLGLLLEREPSLALISDEPADNETPETFFRKACTYGDERGCQKTARKHLTRKRHRRHPKKSKEALRWDSPGEFTVLPKAKGHDGQTVVKERLTQSSFSNTINRSNVRHDILMCDSSKTYENTLIEAEVDVLSTGKVRDARVLKPRNLPRVVDKCIQNKLLNLNFEETSDGGKYTERFSL